MIEFKDKKVEERISATLTRDCSRMGVEGGGGHHKIVEREDDI